MKLWAKLSETSFRLLAKPYLQNFEESSPENLLRRSLDVLHEDSIGSLREFVKSRQTISGGFADRAGKPDLYYTLFGYFVSESLGMSEVFPGIKSYLTNEINRNNINGVHLHCAAILASKLGYQNFSREFFIGRLRDADNYSSNHQPAYYSFLNLMSSWYLGDYTGLLRISRKLKLLKSDNQLPCPVLAAYLVLQKSFRKNVDELERDLMLFHNDNGGFKAVRNAPVTDLLSTAVALYALRFAGHDFREIRPGCLDYVDSLFADGGFGGNVIDTEPDIEYTFYGLLALGSLAD